jgi:hypothetical protein
MSIVACASCFLLSSALVGPDASLPDRLRVGIGTRTGNGLGATTGVRARAAMYGSCGRRLDGGQRESAVRSPATRVLAIWIVALVVGACGRYGAATTASGTPPPADFPVGMWQKQTDGERVTWTFRPDGIWTEVYESLDGSYSGPSKGRYVVTADTVTIDPLFPSSFEPSTHAWRIDNGLLWTTFRDGSQEDSDYFATLDGLPWQRVP